MCAPVIIPTLNRYEHLKECLESLRRNGIASQTEIFISVDFPPSTKYIEGYESIKEYLSLQQEGFKAVHVFFQLGNLGEFANIDFLIDQIRGNYDRFILTEDDNVFAPNFLEYMNICLDKYESDESIYAVCGYMWPLDIKNSSEEVIKINSIFSAWGYGVWLNKMDGLNSHINISELEEIMKNGRLIRNLRRDNQFIYVELIKGFLERTHVLMSGDKVEKIDLAYSIWMYTHGLHMIYPVLSKVRNIGNDGSGQNCVSLDEIYSETKNKRNNNYAYSDQMIDIDIEFGNPVVVDDDKSNEIKKQLNHFFYVTRKELLRSDLAYLMFRLIGRKRVCSILKKLN